MKTERLFTALFTVLAVFFETAFFAQGAAGIAHSPAVENNAVAELGGFLRRENGSQFFFYFFGLLQVIHKTEAVGYSYAVGIHHHGAGDIIKIPENEICGFSAHAGKGGELFHSGGDFSAVLLEKNFGALNDIPCLGMVEAAGMHILLYFRNIGFGKGFEGGETGIQGRGYFVYPLVCALGCEADGEKKLMGLFKFESAVCLRVFLQKEADYIFYLLFGSHLWTVTVPPHSRTGSSLGLPYASLPYMPPNCHSTARGKEAA